MTKTVSFTPEVKLGIAQRWAAAKVNPAKSAAANAVAKRLIANRSRYEAIEAAVGVPWWLIACLHEREASGDFCAYLGNGQPLNRVTTERPAGRGPFITWEAGAIDALTLQGFNKIPRTAWADIAFCLFRAEEYNGEGYRLYHPSTPTPYVWAGTNQYRVGKYASDGKFAPDLVDQQLGVATMLQALISILGPAIIGQIANTNPAPTVPVQQPGAGVTVTRQTTWLNFIIAMVGAGLAAKGLPDVATDAFHALAGVGGVLTAAAALWGHLHVTNASNANTLASIGSLITQIGNIAPQVPAAQAQPTEPPVQA